MNNPGILQSGEPAAAQTGCRANARKRILLVDDEQSFRQAYARLLRCFGYQTETAEDGAAAWEALQANGYDLLITDNNMPKVSGVELVGKMRSAHMTLPVVLVSGTIPAEELERRPWLLLAATLQKPFTGGELLETVKRVLRETDTAGGQIELKQHWRSQPSAVGLRLC